MSTHNIHFHDKIEKKNSKISLNICFLELSEKFPTVLSTSFGKSFYVWRFTQKK